MKSYAEFLCEMDATTNYIDSKGKPLEVDSWYFYSKGNKGKGKKICIVSVNETGIVIEYENSTDSWKIPPTTFNTKYKGYLTKIKK